VEALAARVDLPAEPKSHVHSFSFPAGSARQAGIRSIKHPRHSHRSTAWKRHLASRCRGMLVQFRSIPGLKIETWGTPARERDTLIYG
jgi:hypothetical protein